MLHNDGGGKWLLAELFNRLEGGVQIVDIVEGKLNSMMSGAGTLTRMILPGEGIRVVNVPVDCDVL